MEVSTQISKKGLGDQAMCGRVRIPAGRPCEWGMKLWSLSCNGDPRIL
jgi:hypothetical protein